MAIGINDVYTIYKLEIIYMEAKLKKWGNSDGIRIPCSILKALNLKTKDIVNLSYHEDKIIKRFIRSLYVKLIRFFWFVLYTLSKLLIFPFKIYKNKLDIFILTYFFTLPINLACNTILFLSS